VGTSGTDVQDIKVITHVNLVLWLLICGGMPPFPYVTTLHAHEQFWGSYVDDYKNNLLVRCDNK